MDASSACTQSPHTECEDACAEDGISPIRNTRRHIGLPAAWSKTRKSRPPENAVRTVFRRARQQAGDGAAAWATGSFSVHKPREQLVEPPSPVKTGERVGERDGSRRHGPPAFRLSF